MTVTNSAIFAGSEDDRLDTLFRQYQSERNRRACMTMAVEDRRVSQIDPQAKAVEEPAPAVVSELDSDLSTEEQTVNELFRDYQETRQEDHSAAIANIMAQVDQVLDSQTQSATAASPVKSSTTSMLSRVFNAPGNAVDKVGDWFSGGSRWLVPAGATAAALVAVVAVTNIQQETPAWQQVADSVSVPGFGELIDSAPDELLDSSTSLAFNNMGFSASRDASYQAYSGGKVTAALAGSLHTDDKAQVQTVLGSMKDVYSVPRADAVLTTASALGSGDTTDAEQVDALLSAISTHHQSQSTAPVFELGVWTVIARQAVDARLAGASNIPLETILGALPGISERIADSDAVSTDNKARLAKISLPVQTADADQLRELRMTIDNIDAFFAM